MFKKIYLLVCLVSLCLQPLAFAMEIESEDDYEKKVQEILQRENMTHEEASLQANIQGAKDRLNRLKEMLTENKSNEALGWAKTEDGWKYQSKMAKPGFRPNTPAEDVETLVMYLQAVDNISPEMKWGVNFLLQNAGEQTNSNPTQQPALRPLPIISAENPQTLFDRFRLAVKDFMKHDGMKYVIGSTYFNVGLTYALIDLAAACAGCIGTTLQNKVETKNKKLVSDVLILSEKVLKEIGPTIKFLKQNKAPFHSGCELPIMIAINALDGVVNCKELLAAPQQQSNKDVHQKKTKIIRTLYALEIAMRALVVCETLYENNAYYTAKQASTSAHPEYIQATVSYNARLWQLCANALSIARLGVKHFYHEKKILPVNTSGTNSDTNEEDTPSFYEIEQTEVV